MTDTPPTLEALVAKLRELSARLQGDDGRAIRERLQRVATAVASPGADDLQRARARGEVEQLLSAVASLGAPDGPSARALRDLDAGRIAEALRGFVAYVRDPSPAKRAEVEPVIRALSRTGDEAVVEAPVAAAPDAAVAAAPGTAVAAAPGTSVAAPVAAAAVEAAPDASVEAPVAAAPDASVDAVVDELADARRRSREAAPAGAELTELLTKVRGELRRVVDELKQDATVEAARADAVAQVDALIATAAEARLVLGDALSEARTVFVEELRRIDTSQLADALRVFTAWLAEPDASGAAPIDTLRARLAAERRADDAPRGDGPVVVERADSAARAVRLIDQLFGPKRPRN